ncbi:MAG: glucose 1-dehydrogenase [Pseudomonadota bacterium]|jgi:NAD(P)-dependent dehydrogenase (short-subunit alcohol dehydrogenase family)|nr:glucose 1-dehydrogenase [Pseudomonadota bacterium]MEC8751724.1 glucose 1-dehydrogenase [Pseudomonadota bacterium]|tara:strand:- start:3 stop:776 length:774 start_codon:yes stop_codon:yes gene_type:complete
MIEKKKRSLDRFRLDGLRALVSGAGRGLGHACALALAEAGAEIIALSRTLDELEKLQLDIQSDGGTADIAVCDAADPKQISEIVPKLGQIDILVNNAGTNIPEAFVDVSLNNLDTILDLNVRGAFLMSQAVVKEMLRRNHGGSIIHISSQMGHVGAPNRTVYCASKHAIEGLTKAMGVELGPHGIRVNSVGPTFIETPLTKPFFENKEFTADTISRIALGKIGQVEDVADAVVYLASPASGMVTGSSLLVDGGWTAR